VGTVGGLYPFDLWGTRFILFATERVKDSFSYTPSRPGQLSTDSKSFANPCYELNGKSRFLCLSATNVTRRLRGRYPERKVLNSRESSVVNSWRHLLKPLKTSIVYSQVLSANYEVRDSRNCSRGDQQSVLRLQRAERGVVFSCEGTFYWDYWLVRLSIPSDDTISSPPFPPFLCYDLAFGSCRHFFSLPRPIVP
jgi:hypothetical protein